MVLDTVLNEEAKEYAKAILQKLPMDVVKDGYRTFEINGVYTGILFRSCFVAMMYGEEGALQNDAGFMGDRIEFASEKFSEWVTEDELGDLSQMHFDYPYSVKAAADEILGF